MGSRDRQQREGRDVRQQRPEQKLYALESVVDRGFEDVTDDAEGATRRVHWTIIKRTVADQSSGKAMSAVYVLEREGVASEYPNLGAARTAVNKTIVHPEKLTLSKAEHAAAKK
jgi:CHASE2 domain-containing sensor protein